MGSHLMLEEKDNIIVGLSGGADSSCLLFLICRLIESGYIPRCNITAIHINHGIRGDEALRDEKASETFARKMGVKFATYHIDIPKLAKELKLSEEEAGRYARYESFRTYISEDSIRTGAPESKYKIATAHNANDRAETYLFNLSRGAGLKGLSSISVVNGDIIRPILCLNRYEIEKICNENGIEYVTDSTNNEDVYTRNYIRHQILDRLVNVNEHSVSHINEAADRAKEAYEYINYEADKAYNICNIKDDGNDRRIVLNVDKLTEYQPIIRKYIYSKSVEHLSGSVNDIYKSRIDAIDELVLSGTTGKVIQLGRGIVVKLQYGTICFGYEHSSKEDIKEDEEIYFITDTIQKQLENGETVNLQFSKFALRLYKTEKVIKNDNECYTKYFDYDRIRGNICFRKRRTQDVMIVSTNGATKKVKSVFIDAKVPRETRDDIWIMADGDSCLWAVGVRQSVDSFVKDNSAALCIEWIQLT